MKLNIYYAINCELTHPPKKARSWACPSAQFEVRFSKSVAKQIGKLPSDVPGSLNALVRAIKLQRPVLKAWAHNGKLQGTTGPIIAI